MQDEVWKPVPDAPGYEASSMGRVKGPRCILKPFLLTSGYLGVRVGGKGTTVHASVARAFHGRAPTPTHEVNHISGVKSDNTPGNLEWVTRQENVDHAKAIGLLAARRKRPKRAVPMPVLPDDDWLGGRINGCTVMMRLTRDPGHRCDQWRVEIDGVIVAHAMGLVDLCVLLRGKFGKAPSRRMLATICDGYTARDEADCLAMGD